jgi:hypothetical protein
MEQRVDNPQRGSLSLRQTFRYSGIRAHEDSIARTKSYLGDKLFNLFVAEMGAFSFRQLRFHFMMAGVEGYPVNAMIREYHPRYVRRFGAPSKRPKLRLVQGGDDGQ